MLNKHELKTYIYSKYDSLKDCAAALGIDESTLSRNIKNPSISFLQRLRGIYVDVPLQPDMCSHL